MTVNILGPGHYENTNETLVRPSPSSTGIDGLSWFAQCDAEGNGGTNIDDLWLNALLAELRKLIQSAGGTQSETSEQMISEAVARYASGGIFGVDSGGASAYVVDTTLNFILPKSYFLGMRVIFRAVNAPTGASTINVNSIGVKALRRPDGSAMTGTEFGVGALVDAFYDPAAVSGAGAFRLAPWALAAASPTTTAVAPIYPEIETNGGLPTFTVGTGSIAVDGGITWIHRALNRYASSDISSPNRTFATSQNKTYHLRWYAPGHANAPAVTYPNGRFMLRDLADSASYNPGGAAENDPSFDTTFDDMLLAKVTTNGSNALTVTALYNKAFLIGNSLYGETNSSYHDVGNDAALDNAGVGGGWVRNWSRKGESSMANVVDITSYQSGFTEMNFGVYTRDRYVTRIFGETQSATGNGWYIRATAVA